MPSVRGASSYMEWVLAPDQPMGKVLGGFLSLLGTWGTGSPLGLTPAAAGSFTQLELV